MEGSPRKKKSTSTARAGSRKGSERLARAAPPARAAAASDTPTDPPSGRDLFATIRERAYLLYVESGYQHGHDIEHWLEAERQLADPGIARQQDVTADPS